MNTHDTEYVLHILKACGFNVTKETLGRRLQINSWVDIQLLQREYRVTTPQDGVCHYRGINLQSTVYAVISLLVEEKDRLIRGALFKLLEHTPQTGRPHGSTKDPHGFRGQPPLAEADFRSETSTGQED